MSQKEEPQKEGNELLGIILEWSKFVVTILYIWIRDSVLAILPKQKKDLVGQVVVITGGGRGIGRQVAINLAKLGAKIVLWDINENGVKQVAEEITQAGGKAFWYICDVTSEKDVNRTAEAVVKDVGEVDILINNAGIMQNVPMMELDSVRIKQTMDINVLAHFWTIRAFYPSMEKRNSGHIVAIGSGVSFVGQVNQVDYTASKHAVLGLMKAFSQELRMKNSDVKLTTICPLTVDTGLNQHPVTKFSWLMPIVSVEEAARTIVDAIRREEFIVTIPRSMQWLICIMRLLPRDIFLHFMEFTDYCRQPNNDASRLPPPINKKYT